MGDGHEVPEEFAKKEQRQTTVAVVCHGCGAMTEDVIVGEDRWLFCPCGTGIIRVTT